MDWLRGSALALDFSQIRPTIIARQGEQRIMPTGTTIVSVSARQVYSDRGHPGVEATVTTAGGAQGVAICTAGISVGSHEVEFAYDGGKKWRGKGVMAAVNAVNEHIAPALVGMDAAQQQAVDQ